MYNLTGDALRQFRIFFDDNDPADRIKFCLILYELLPTKEKKDRFIDWYRWETAKISESIQCYLHLTKN